MVRLLAALGLLLAGCARGQHRQALRGVQGVAEYVQALQAGARQGRT